ncbi:MAG: 2-amino-4-hydroxy-6-hydroxymethyldihydropteridine diphosphokinase [Pseudomonadota bacterium]
MTNSALIYISLGSNINPNHHIPQALQTIAADLSECSISPIYRSAAVGMQGADFLNAVAGGYTTTDVASITRWLKNIEQQHNRIRGADKFTDRTLDLDLLLYNQLITDDLPHHDIEEQAYVLQPLVDLAPQLIHPTLQVSMSALRNRLSQTNPDLFTALTTVTL